MFEGLRALDPGSAALVLDVTTDLEMVATGLDGRGGAGGSRHADEASLRALDAIRHGAPTSAERSHRTRGLPWALASLLARTVSWAEVAAELDSVAARTAGAMAGTLRGPRQRLLWRPRVLAPRGLSLRFLAASGLDASGLQVRICGAARLGLPPSVSDACGALSPGRRPIQAARQAGEALAPPTPRTTGGSTWSSRARTRSP